MAGVSKANQRQSQKRKRLSKHQFRKVKMNAIPFVCSKCNQTGIYPTAIAYGKGGVKCPRCKTKMSMNTKEFTTKLTSKK